jgi:hypothetical protein
VEMAYTTISRDKLTLCLLVQLLSPDETIWESSLELDGRNFSEILRKQPL